MNNYFNLTLIKVDLLKLPYLIISLFILSIGIGFARSSDLGLDAWGTFHNGIAIYSGYSFGTVSVTLGLIIMLISLPLGVVPGIGTLFNVLLVGIFIDCTWSTIESINLNSFLLLFIGFIVTNFGRALYISANLGSGPRDALYISLSRITKFKITFIKPAIEITIIILGIYLGATIGPGLILMTLFSGGLIEIFFRLLKYEPRNKVPSNFLNYVNK